MTDPEFTDADVQQHLHDSGYEESLTPRSLAPRLPRILFKGRIEPRVIPDDPEEGRARAEAFKEKVLARLKRLNLWRTAEEIEGWEV